MCLKNTQNVSLEFLILAFFHQFLSLHGNTVWLQPVGFQKLAKLDHVEYDFFVIFKHCDIYILSGQKFIENAKIGQFWQVMGKPQACGQTVLPDKSISIKSVENAEIDKCDIFGDFQTLWTISVGISGFSGTFWMGLVKTPRYHISCFFTAAVDTIPMLKLGKRRRGKIIFQKKNLQFWVSWKHTILKV